MITKFRIKNNTLSRNGRFLSANDQYLSYVNATKDEINSYVFDAVNGEISATKLTENLFPTKQPHIFISHSSKDANLAISFANALYSTYGIISFIDSQLWAHIDFALKEMHEKYCKTPSGTSYYYSRSNNLLSHMHAILSMALMRVMDNSDCVIFIESEHSIYNFMEDEYIHPYSKIRNPAETLSPWISTEVNFANKLRRNGHIDRDLLIKAASESYRVDESVKDLAKDGMPKIIHEIDVSDFVEITSRTLQNAFSITRTYPIHNLDMMYGKFYQG
ncbi:hypothetical protein RA259_004254 [Cronobacter sakazakii]|nr:hypothetical protein [Cronobacter sakazakii]